MKTYWARGLSNDKTWKLSGSSGQIHSFNIKFEH
ncbi:HutD family protein [Caenorhabditis elegans]|uniref:HutD family protein n=1 Tax=Caenorhabditis elegans TaxID=6239 RepID=U4PFF9_CAEEL|nr:HutD family protein [Caenorhabditis elegans]CDH93476.1 HutD family protein [Caenorhabditis elegans]|eukprot:NP_001294776.1 Uncharacterized protein CELE_F32F2.4 [Caenorhabditis elegans]